MARPFTAAAVTALAVLTACALPSVKPRLSDTGGRSTGGAASGPSSTPAAGTLVPRGPVDPAAGGDLGGQGVATAARGRDGARVVADQRRVCRSGSRPTGWIAVAYVPGNGECPAHAGGDSVSTAAILARYGDRPRDTILDVCADERLPSGWVVEDAGVSDVNGSCPGASRNGGSETRRIRRAR
jgi:hypothetical protein